MKTLLAKHRSIRKFRSEPIAPEVLQDMLEAASRASTCGNMQLYSLIVTQSRELREALAPCHFNQPMVTQDRKSTRLNSSHIEESRMPSSA